MCLNRHAHRHQCYTQADFVSAMDAQRSISLSLILLMLFSTLTLLVGPVDEVSAATAQGTITSDEVWSGTHTVTGDILITAGAKVIIQPGTQVSLNNGTMITVRGNLCAGDISCGSSGMANNGSRIQFTWADPGDSSQFGDCYDGALVSGYSNIDPSCGEGILLKDSIDVGQTKLNHVSIVNAYGLPAQVSQVNNEFRIASLVLDGASPTLEALKFQGINTTSVLALNLATPTFIGGEFVNGDDETEVAGQGVQIYGAGTSFTPVVMNSPIFTGSSKGCGQQDGGRHVLWAEDSYVLIDHPGVASGDYGLRIDDSAGIVRSATISVSCSAIDINGPKRVSGVKIPLEITTSSLTTADKAGLTIYDDAMLYFHILQLRALPKVQD